MFDFRTGIAAACLAFAAGSAQASCTLPSDANAFANEMARGINASRAANGLAPLRFSRELSRAATNHACDMQARGFFAHQGSDGSSSHDRVTRVGYDSCTTAENIAWGYPQAMTVVNGWMNSAGHRRNMLLPNIKEFGIGLADGGRGPYAVLVVALPCDA